MAFRNNKTAGFTIIELLVVLAIVALLAVLGAFAYTKYIDATRASLMESSRKQFMRLLEIEIARPTAAANGANYLDCYELIDAAITASNKVSSNVYTQWSPVWLNGHRMVAASGVVGSVVEWGQGEHLVMCDSPHTEMSSGNNVAICSCTDKLCRTSAAGNYNPDDLSNCPNPRGY
jgi:hypothetical protein